MPYLNQLRLAFPRRAVLLLLAFSPFLSACTSCEAARQIYSYWPEEFSTDDPLFFLDVPLGTEDIDLRVAGSTDVEIYAKWDEPPTSTSYDFTSLDPRGGQEYLQDITPAGIELPARLYVLVHMLSPNEGAFIEADMTCGDAAETQLDGPGATCPIDQQPVDPSNPPDPNQPAPVDALCNDRFQVLEEGSTEFCSYYCDGSGRVLDLSTGFTWTQQPADVLPVYNSVSFEDAKALCDKLQMRLPTIEEYEAVFDVDNFCSEAFPLAPSSGMSSTPTGDSSRPGLGAYYCYLRDVDSRQYCTNRPAVFCLSED